MCLFFFFLVDHCLFVVYLWFLLLVVFGSQRSWYISQNQTGCKKLTQKGNSSSPMAVLKTKCYVCIFFPPFISTSLQFFVFHLQCRTIAITHIHTQMHTRTRTHTTFSIFLNEMLSDLTSNILPHLISPLSVSLRVFLFASFLSPSSCPALYFLFVSH